VHSRDGQNWSFPPINPHVLEEQGFWYWREVLNQAMRHAGMVRIDHAMGLVRQFWIPKGRPASEGAYVRYPFDALVRILAQESRRRKVVVVGEDLGTVPPGFKTKLHARGIVSTRVMFFERTGKGGFKRSSSYEKNAITSASTHDLAPLAGWWNGTDLELRRKLGLIEGTAAWERAIVDRARDRRALLRALQTQGLIGSRLKDVSVDVLRDAVQKFLKRTPSKLIAFMLDDLALETEPINLPGVGPDKHASWTRRMSSPVE
jgi:4-alpha-glucanotransferase